MMTALQGGRGITPRKTERLELKVRGRYMLQGGRGITPRKTVNLIERAQALFKLQGGRGITPRKTKTRSPITGAWCCFNEAAALHRGKPVVLSEGTDRASASMRPRHYTAENFLYDDQATEIIELQGGRGITPRKTPSLRAVALGILRLQGGRGITPRKTDPWRGKAPSIRSLQGGRGITPRKT